MDSTGERTSHQYLRDEGNSVIHKCPRAQDHGRAVVLLSDNTTVVVYFKRKRGIVSLDEYAGPKDHHLVRIIHGHQFGKENSKEEHLHGPFGEEEHS